MTPRTPHGSIDLVQQGMTHRSEPGQDDAPRSSLTTADQELAARQALQQGADARFVGLPTIADAARDPSLLRPMTVLEWADQLTGRQEERP